MGSDGVKWRQHRALSAESPKTGAVREAPLPRKQLAGGQRHESPFPWLFDCMGEKHVVLLAKRSKNNF